MSLHKKQNKTVAIISGVLLFLSASLVLADSERDIAVDMAIGGMREGSRILPPGAYERGVRGNHLSSGMDARSIAPASQGADKATVGSAVGGVFPGGSSQSIGSSPSAGANPISSPSESGNNPINGPVDTGTNPVNSPLDTSADHINAPLDTNAGGASGTESSSAGTETVSGGSSNPVIDVDLQADLDSGTVDAGLGIDTSGDQLLEADVSGTTFSTTGTVEADIGSVSDVTTEDATVVTEPLETVLSPESPLIGEVDASAETVASEPEVGVEADVEGVSAGEDVVADPADGISAGL